MADAQVDNSSQAMAIMHAGGQGMVDMQANEAAGQAYLSSYGAAYGGPGGYGGYAGGPAAGGYGGYLQGGVDISQMQAQAIANQQMLYGMYGQPYPPTAAGLMGGMPQTMYGGALPMAASFYAGIPQFPGPCPYDPYGMLNPAACVIPLAAPSSNNQSKITKKKKDKKWWCC